MRNLLSLTLAVAGGAVISSACYSERQPPPTYRYTCDATSDCADGEVCSGGICERPCTLATFADDCPDESHLACVNGVCSSGCEIGGDSCPKVQECLDLGVDLGGGGGFFGGGSDAPVGVCGRLCDAEGAPACPEGDVCVAGFCATACATSETCASGLVCSGGICLPDLGGSSGADSGASSSGTDGTGAGTTSDGTGTGGTT